jgi:hypothetical protein
VCSLDISALPPHRPLLTCYHHIFCKVTFQLLPSRGGEYSPTYEFGLDLCLVLANRV